MNEARKVALSGGPPGEGDGNGSVLGRRWRAAQTDAASAAILAEDERYFLRQTLSTPCLGAVRKVEGLWIEDVAGRRFMDFHGNNVHHVGHANPRVIAAIKRQLDELTFTPRRYTDGPAVDLARKLVDIAPEGLGKVLLATGGSDAIDMAIKLARAVTGRFKTLSFWDSFHGAGFGGLSVGGEALFRSGPAGPLLPGSEHVAPFACYRCPYGHPDREGKPDLAACRLTCAEMVRYVLAKEGDVAAVIAEPLRAIPYIPPPGYWQAVREACDAHGTLLIFDEIPFGLGKTGRMFVHEHFGVTPDILVLGKALGGGVLPIAAMIARSEFDVAAGGALGHYTHEKNPVTARAALTTIEVIESEGLVAKAARMGTLALARLEAMKARHPLIGDVRGLGLVLGVDLVSDRAAKTPAVEAAERIMYRALERGLNFKVSMGSVLTLTPPLIVTEDEMTAALDILESCIAEEAPGASR